MNASEDRQGHRETLRDSSHTNTDRLVAAHDKRMEALKDNKPIIKEMASIGAESACAGETKYKPTEVERLGIKAVADLQVDATLYKLDHNGKKAVEKLGEALDHPVKSYVHDLLKPF